MRLRHKNKHLPGFISCLILTCCCCFAQTTVSIKNYTTAGIGAQQFVDYLPFLKNKNVGIVTNNTGVIGNTSIVDTLLALKVSIKKIFGPEHGFRGDVEAGEKVKTKKDKKTGIKVISLYGANKKPNKEQLKDLDVLVYDIQDIGVRFYTYISTLTYLMEACAENGKELIVLDRPNPNGFYIDGPVLRDPFKSFLGLHKVPLVYGMTTGEYAMMVNNEGWLNDSVRCNLRVIAMKNYDRKCSYRLPVKPSPNIPNETAVLLYPSLGLFEGTLMSVGRGTEFPFQVLGHPEFLDKTFSFVPKPSALSLEPKYVNQICYGIDFRKSLYLATHPKQINLAWLIYAFAALQRDDFFDKNFNYHVGNKELQEQIKNKIPESIIRQSWHQEIDAFKKIRKKYLLYDDFTL